jgi:hypothetical protein
MITLNLKRLIEFMLFTLATTAPLSAQLQAPYERVLVPIYLNSPIPGAYGSIWTTDFTARNESTSTVEVTGGRLPSSCPQPPCGYQPLSTFSPAGVFVNPNGGLFFYVGAPGAGKVTFNLRVRDLSRQALTWGTSIPVVREAQTYTNTLQLLDVPTDSRFRVALRVYDFDLPSGRSVQLRIYDQTKDKPFPIQTENLLVNTVLQLSLPASPGTQYDAIPGSAVITDLIGAFPQLASAPLLRIVLDPVSSDLRFWALASVTNNETQHVTTITPNK